MTEKSSNENERFKEIADNIFNIKARIEAAAAKSGRKSADITLVAVTKTMPTVDIATAFECGITVFGENRVQELLLKLPQLDMSGRSVHLIGHLQTNKVKQIIDKVNMIQSVDSLRLAAEIDSQAEVSGRNMDVLCEVNIGGEASKSGVAPDLLPGLLKGMTQMRHIRVCGLMTIPPFCEDKGQTRYYFAKMSKLFIDIRGEKTDNINMHILSMGMSSDFDVAIEEGSNMVRVGTAIFGKR
jgi:pyridoxal phosphate enzyme (YggS family)